MTVFLGRCHKRNIYSESSGQLCAAPFQFCNNKLDVRTPYGRAVFNLRPDNGLVCRFADIGVLTSDISFNESKGFVGIGRDSINMGIKI